MPSASKVRQRKASDGGNDADIDLDLDAECSEGFFGHRQLRIIRVMSVIQVCLLLGFAHCAVFKRAGVARQEVSAVRPLTEESLSVSIAGHPEGILVNFHTATCDHCVKLAPEFEKAARELSSASSKSPGSNVVFASVDTVSAPRAASRYGVTHLPTMLWFRKGERVQEVPASSRTAKKIADFVAWASAPSVIEFSTRAELQESLSELRSALPVGGPPVIVGFSPTLAKDDSAVEKPAVQRQEVFNVLEIAAERMRGETAFLYIKESWARDPSFRAYFWDAAADLDYNGTLTQNSVEAWAKGLLAKRPKKLSQ